MAEEGLSEEVIFEQRPEGNEDVKTASGQALRSVRT